MVCAFSLHVLIWIAYCNGKGIIQEGPAGQLHTNSVFCTHFCNNRDGKEKSLYQNALNQQMLQKTKTIPWWSEKLLGEKASIFAPLLANIHD